MQNVFYVEEKNKKTQINSRPVSISGPVSLSQFKAAQTDYTLVVPYLAPITIDYGHVIIGNTIY